MLSANGNLNETSAKNMDLDQLRCHRNTASESSFSQPMKTFIIGPPANPSPPSREPAPVVESPTPVSLSLRAAKATENCERAQSARHNDPPRPWKKRSRSTTEAP